MSMTSETSITERLETLEKKFSEAEARAARKDADNKRLLKENGEKDEEIKNLRAQIAWFQQQMFGHKSERRDPFAGMPGLFPEFNGTPAVPDEPQPEPEKEESDKERRHRKRQVRVMTENLPVLEREVIEPEGVDLNLYRRIGEEVTRIVKHQPGKLYVKEIVRPKYGLKSSVDPVERGKGVLIAPMPLLPIPKGLPDASLLTEIYLDKFEYHAPFYRIIKKFYHMGLRGLKETTVVGWFKKGMELLRPLYKALEEEVFRYDYHQTDESVLRVINKEKHEASQEYVWMTRAVIPRLVLFYYDPGDRTTDVIEEKWKTHHFTGYNQCDGFAAYTAARKTNPGVKLVFCMAHIRRHVRKAETENRKAAQYMLARIQKLYVLERQYKEEGLDYALRRDRRQKEAGPIMDELRTWMETEGIKYSESTLMGQAVTYAYTRWDGMENCLADGHLEIDNNLAEGEIRPITLGRKNYMFCGNHEAAGNLCVVMSLLATCRNHNVNPRAYFNDVISRMPYMDKASHEELVQLLPHRWKLSHPDEVMEDFRELQKS